MTTCYRGHLLDAKNTKTRSSGRHECRICLRERQALSARRRYADGKMPRRSGPKLRRAAEKQRANTAVNEAKRKGLLAQPEHCESCGFGFARLHAHHRDYAKPLAVVWLCPACHMKEHRKYGSGTGTLALDAAKGPK